MTEQNIEKLLDKQTKVILSAVDEKLSMNRVVILSDVERKLEKMELRINQKIDKLTTTLDKFLKRMTDMEDEFTLMKQDINRLKRVIGEKLGIDLA